MQYHIQLDAPMLEGAEYAILAGDPGRIEAIAQHLERPKRLGQNREYTSFLGYVQGRPVLVMSHGIGGPSTAIAVEELAQLLGGVVGATRPAIEEGWVSRAHQVGQSGKIVSPALYIACGVSGATQHVSGMSGSGYVVAINKDEDAPIFDVADVGIVGDVAKVLPLMIEEIRQRKAE